MSQGIYATNERRLSWVVEVWLSGLCLLFKCEVRMLLLEGSRREESRRDGGVVARRR